MNLGIAGRRALVVGSSSGIGAEIAKALAAEGARIVVHGRSTDAARDVCWQIRKAGGEAISVLGDLGDASAVDTIAMTAARAYSGIDILINSAGAAEHFAPWFDISLDSWERQYRLTTLYAVQLIHKLSPGMQAAGWGRIINISSAVVYQPSAYAPDYTGAKAALHCMTPGLADALGSSGVTVNTICSGTMLTANTRKVMEDHARELGFSEQGGELEKRVATDIWPNRIGRLGRPEEVAAAACFLASEQAAFITGTTLRVDGGMGNTVN